MLDVCVCDSTDLEWQPAEREGWSKKHSHSHTYSFIHSFHFRVYKLNMIFVIIHVWNKSRACYSFAHFSVASERAFAVLRSSFIPKCTCIYTILLLFIILEHNTILLTPSSFSHTRTHADTLSHSFACVLFLRVIIPMKSNPRYIHSFIFAH